MYLEERVEQLETIATDQGRQIELVAGGLATLTVEVRGIRQDMTDGFARVDRQFEQVDLRFEQVDLRFDSVDQRFDSVDQRFDSVDQRFDELREEFAGEFTKVRQEFTAEFTKVRQEFAGEFAKVNQRLDEMNTNQTLIISILTDKLK